MRVLLVRPKPHSETIGLQNVMICEPIELEYIYSYIKDIVEDIQIVDMILEKKPLSYFIKKFQPDIVGITSYIAHVNIVKCYAKEIKASKPDCKVAVGGVHAEVVPEDFKDPHIDYIIQGNGLKTFREIVLAGKRNLEDYICPDGVWSEKNKYCSKETQFHYPHPDRKSVIKYRNKYYYMFHNPCALIKTSFGCPYSCSFCFCRQVTDGKYFTRDLEDVIEELKSIPEREVYIVDDDFLVDRNRILEFCSLLRKNDIHKKFLIYGRADFIAVNEDVIKEFSKCGLRAVIVGIESNSDSELIKYNKKSTVGVNERAVDILKRADVECYGTLILGIDWGVKEFDGLYRWIKKLSILFVNLQPFTPMPGTSLIDEYKDSLSICREEFEKWDLAHLVIRPSAMSVRNYYWNIIKLYYKLTMNPSNILKMISKYGLKENIKLSAGAVKITWQYIKKCFKSRG